jgi:hypothetical protein
MANITNNRINITMTTAQVAAVKSAIATIQTNMPFLLGLTLDERIQLPKINVANKAFTEDAINAVANNSSLLPGYLNLQNMQNDLQLFSQLDEIIGMLNSLLEKLQDTQTLAGSEAYVAALTAYKLFGAASDAGIAGTDAIYDQLRTRFTQSGSSSSTPPTQ